MATDFRIFADEWDPQSEQIIINASSPRAGYLESVAWTVKHCLERFRSVVGEYTFDGRPISVERVVEVLKSTSDANTLFEYMEQTVRHYQRLGQLRTGETYAATLSSFRRFRGGVDVALGDIDCTLFEDYEGYLKRRGLSPNTRTFYLKHLRTAYRRAVEEELVVDRKPFRRVSTATERTAKRAIPLQLIRRLKQMDCSDLPAFGFARDMFLFSFYTRGMSFVDIAYLQKKNLKDGVLSYRRKKTNQQLTIRWEPCMQEILDRYAADSSSPYLFAIISAKTRNPRRQYQNTQSRINRSLKQLGEMMGLSLPLTMYCARHSWASIARDRGVPISVISQGMGHDSEKTTRIYLASLRTEVIDRANRKILSLL